MPANMFHVLHASHNGRLYRAHVRGVADIADMVREQQLETLSTADRRASFWVAGHFTHVQYVNRTATAIYLAATGFTAREVPLLRGNVVITGTDEAGELASLGEEQMTLLINADPSTCDERTLGRRFWRDERQNRRQFKLTKTTRTDTIVRPWT
jgi:hypothetical protein